MGFGIDKVVGVARWGWCLRHDFFVSSLLKILGGEIMPVNGIRARR